MGESIAAQLARLTGRDEPEPDFPRMSLAEAERYMVAEADKVASIKSQLEASNGFGDDGWRERATHALRMSCIRFDRFCKVVARLGGVPMSEPGTPSEVATAARDVDEMRRAKCVGERLDCRPDGIRPASLVEAERMIAEHSAAIESINGQLATKTRFHFDTNEDFERWRRMAKSSLAYRRATVVQLKQWAHEMRSDQTHATSPGAAEELARNLAAEVERLQARVAEVEAERDRLSGSTAMDRFAPEFVEVARIVLSEQTFNRIQARARDRVSSRPTVKR